MAEYTDEQLSELSDEELEAAFKEAKESIGEVPEVPDTSEEFIVEEDEPEVMEDEEEVLDSLNDDEDAEDDEVETMEQPEEDSDDDTSSDDEDEEELEDDSEESEDEPDTEDEDSEEQTEEEEDNSEEEEQPLRKLKYKANGQEFEFTEQEVMEKFGQVFGQSMNYTKKMQQIKPWRKTIDALEEAGISNNNLGDLMKALDVVRGDKDAIASIIKQNNIDALDLDTENDNYVPKDYGRDDTELAIYDIVDEISADREYAITHNILEKQWDDASRSEFVKDPEMIRLLHMDVKSGTYDRVNSIAQKLKVYDGGRNSDLDYYKEASSQYFKSMAEDEQRANMKAQREAAEQERQEAEAQKVQQVKQKQARQKATKQASAKRKAAATPKKASNSKKVTDYLDESDEAFEDWYNNLQEAY